MKYLKRYNEELRSSTYQRAADLLSKKGHKRRSSVIGDWAKVTKEKEQKQFIENCKKLGVFRISLHDPKQIVVGTQLVSRKGQLFLTGNFYLNFYFDEESWKEDIKDWKNGDRDNLYITFMLGIIPADEDTKLEMEGGDYINKCLGNPTDNGTYWVGRFSTQVSDNAYGDVINPRGARNQGGLYLETWELKVLFADRRNANKFISLIYGIFKGDIDHSSSVHPDTKEVIMDHLFDDAELTIDEFEDLIDSIKRTKTNQLYLD